MSDEISRYEAVQAEEKKQAQEQAAKDAEAKRAQEEKAVKKQTFMQALERTRKSGIPGNRCRRSGI